jgi:branched-chain amino acid transport system ATP-binding protein
MIAISELTVQFGGVRPLDALSAELSAGIVGLIGPNGAGKTTLLNVLSGFVKPVAGAIVVDGVQLLPLSPVQRVMLGLRRSFQQELVVEDLTAAENVQAIADHVCHAHDAKADVDRAIDFVGLTERRNVVGRRLTLFERRMVEIAKTLIGKPKIILLDEPGAGLNDAETQRLRRVLLGIPAGFGVQVVLIDHDADLIASVCEQTMVLDFGKRLALGPTRAVLDDPLVRRAYLGTA